MHPPLPDKTEPATSTQSPQVDQPRWKWRAWTTDFSKSPKTTSLLSSDWPTCSSRWRSATCNSWNLQPKWLQFHFRTPHCSPQALDPPHFRTHRDDGDDDAPPWCPLRQSPCFLPRDAGQRGRRDARECRRKMRLGNSCGVKRRWNLPCSMKEMISNW